MLEGLIFIRKLHDLSLEGLSEKLDVSLQTVHKWEKKQRPIPQQRLEQLEELFNIDKFYFTKEDLTKLDQLRIQKIKLEQSSKNDSNRDIIEKIENEILKEELKQKLSEAVDVLLEDNTEEEFLKKITNALSDARTKKNMVEGLENILQNHNK